MFYLSRNLADNATIHNNRIYHRKYGGNDETIEVAEIV
jgi:hypothetical protein